MISFGIQSSLSSLYLAFITEAEKIGWKYNNRFTPKIDVDSYTIGQRKCLYFSNSFSAYPNELTMSFSTSETDRLLYNLDTDFLIALEYIKQVYKDYDVKIVKNITDDYDAVLTDEGIKVGCNLVRYDKFKELVKLVQEHQK